MKRLLLFCVFVVSTMFIMAQVSDSTAVISYDFGDSAMEFLKANWYTLVAVALFFISEWIGESDLPENSIWRKLLNMAQGFFKKKAGKATVIVGAMLFLGNGLSEVSAQSKWDGFFKPVDVVLDSKATFKATDEPVIDKGIWLFRPSVALTAVAFDFSGKDPVSVSLNTLGFGASYGKYSEVNEVAYCTYSFNAFLLTSVEIGGAQTTKLGGEVTVDVFNKIMGLGIGYIDKKAMLLTTISYSF